MFTKYGRIGEPKQRVVWLNDDETKILWRDRYRNEDPRSLAVSELVDVQIGSDHTPVMRKQNIPTNFDHYCISIMGKERSLDLMIQDTKVVRLWAEKIKQLIEPLRRSQLSPDRPSAVLGDVEPEVRVRDQVPEPLLLLWQDDILHNFHHYWDAHTHELRDTPVTIRSQQLNQAVQ